VSSGATNLLGPTAGLCRLPARQGIGTDQVKLTAQKSTTHGEGSDQLPRNEGTSRPRHTGVDKTAWHWRLGPTVYEVCSFRLKDSSVTTVAVQIAFLRGVILPPSARGRRGSTSQPPPGADSVSRRNEASGTDCGALPNSYTARHRTGSTTMHRGRKVPRTTREATNYHAPKEIAVCAKRGSRRRFGLGSWDPRFISYAPFV
jgi:hypothetical protein